MVFVARKTQKNYEGFTKLASHVASLIMCLRSGSRIKSAAHLPPLPFSTCTSLGPRHFDSHSHLFLTNFGSGNAELRTIQNQKKGPWFMSPSQSFSSMLLWDNGLEGEHPSHGLEYFTPHAPGRLFVGVAPHKHIGEGSDMRSETKIFRGWLWHLNELVYLLIGFWCLTVPSEIRPVLSWTILWYNMYYYFMVLLL